MTDNKTFKLRYIGARFGGARLPVNVLSDLPAFRDLLVSFAKDIWKESHLDRQRVPKGFDASLTLDLTAIEEGSAVPNLVWSRKTAQATLPGFEDELEAIVEESYSSILELFNGVAQGSTSPELSSEKLRALDKFGAGLWKGDRIELQYPSDDRIVFLDAERRKRLITSVRDTYKIRLTGFGTLASNSLYGHIIVRTDRGDMSVPVDPQEIIDDFDGSLDQSVQYDVLVEVDRADQIRKVLEVFDIGVVDASIEAGVLKCRERLAEISRLKAGWHHGAALAINPMAIKSAETFINARPSFAPAINIYPNEEAGVLIELEAGGWDISLEFHLNGSIEMYGIEIAGTDEMEPQIFVGDSEQLLNEFDLRVGN